MSIETKRYRLLKDLYSNSNDLIIPKDSVFEFKPEYNGYMCLGITAILSKETVEGKLSHFELIPEQSKLSNDKGSGRVEVSDIMEANTNVGRRTYAGYAFTSSKLIPPDKFPLIKLLIERFLNDEYRIHIDGTWSIHSHGERTFIQSEVDTIREDLWNRCREWADGQWSNQFFPDGKNSQFKYPTLQDYINSANENKSIKPPLGLMPMWLWREQRLDDINSAIERYKGAGKEIPQEWINEQYDLSKQIKTQPEPPSNKVGKDKDWEILEFRYSDNKINRVYLKPDGIYRYGSGMESGSLQAHLREPKWLIHSVKRLSDGVVFSIGDYVGITKESGKSIKGWKDIIESFLIVDDTMVSVFKTFRQPINDLDKLTPTEETDKAVTNNDDVACLSLNDVMAEFGSYGNGHYESLYKKVKEKLKQPEVIQYTFDNPKGKIKLP